LDEAVFWSNPLEYPEEELRPGGGAAPRWRSCALVEELRPGGGAAPRSRS